MSSSDGVFYDASLFFHVRHIINDSILDGLELPDIGAAWSYQTDRSDYGR